MCEYCYGFDFNNEVWYYIYVTLYVTLLMNDLIPLYSELLV